MLMVVFVHVGLVDIVIITIVEKREVGTGLAQAMEQSISSSSQEESGIRGSRQQQVASS